MENYLKHYSPNINNNSFELNHTNYRQQQQQPSVSHYSLNQYSTSPTPTSIDHIEEDRLAYNYLTGEIRLPPHYISPEDRKQQQVDDAPRRNTFENNNNNNNYSNDYPPSRKLSFKK